MLIMKYTQIYKKMIYFRKLNVICYYKMILQTSWELCPFGVLVICSASCIKIFL